MKTLTTFQIEYIMCLYEAYEWSEITEKFNAKFGTDYKEDNLRISYHRKKDLHPDLEFTRNRFEKREPTVLQPGVRIMVTSACPTHVIDNERVGQVLPDVLKTLKSTHYAQSIILTGIGHTKLGEKQSAYYDIALKPLINQMFSSVKLHAKLEAKDYKINPQQMKPLSRLYKEGQRHNLIIASPKQHLEVAIVGNNKMPHTVQSTGCITEPSYQNNGIGTIAKENHVRGGIIVESNAELFVTRKVRINDDGSYFDLDSFIKGNKTVKGHRSECLILGDAHVEHEDKGLTALLYEAVKVLKPKRIVLHDLADGVSASPFLVGSERSGIPSILEEAAKVLDWLDRLYAACGRDVEIISANSNHHHFFDRWLRAGLYHSCPVNHRIGLEMKIAQLDGVEPIEFLLRRDYLTHLGPNDDYFVGDIQVANHGHRGPNGAKGSKANTGRMAYRSVTAHTHEPFERDNHTGVGHWSVHRHGYNTGASGWLASFAIIQPDYSIQQIIPVKDRKGQWHWRF